MRNRRAAWQLAAAGKQYDAPCKAPHTHLVLFSTDRGAWQAVWQRVCSWRYFTASGEIVTVMTTGDVA